VQGTVARRLAAVRLAESLPGLLGTRWASPPRWCLARPGEASGSRGSVFDATGLTASSQLGALQEFFSPKLRSLETSPRVVVLGTPPEQ
jgi:3-oxoacyl-[acyl-carrier protein] reductase